MTAHHPHMPPRRSRLGQISLVVICGVVLLVIGLVAAVSLRSGGAGAGGARQADRFVVRKGGFDITIPVTGELAALKQIDIRNMVDGRAIITEVVPEGSFVQQGEILLRLNDDELRNKAKDAQDAVNNAETAVVAAETNHEIKVKTRDSDVAKAKLDIELAKLALQAWKEGEDVSKRKELDLAIETADKEYARLVKRFEDSGKLKDQNFISEDEYKRDEIAMIQARAKIEQARLDKDVYEKYIYEQNRATKQSDLDQATAEYDRVMQRSDAAVRSAQSELDSKKYQLESAKQKHSDLLVQLGFCAIKAPSSGLVVYYSSTQTGGMGRNEGRPPQVGTELSRNEPVIILPDTSQMVAAVKISEALVGQIQKGQRASITCDALADHPLSGEVVSVGVLAESGGWRDPNRRDYTVKIVLHEGKELGLKPSMRCKAVINVGRVDDAPHVPVQAIFRDGSLSFVYVPDGSGYSQRKVATGRSSELYMEVIEGLKDGETVLLREPEADEITSRLEGFKAKSSNGATTGDQPDPGAAGGAAIPAMPTAGGPPANVPNAGGMEGGPSNGPTMGAPGSGGGNRGTGRNRGERRPGGDRPPPSGGGSTEGAAAPAAPSAK